MMTQPQSAVQIRDGRSTETERSRAAAEVAPRRLEVLDEILWRLRQEILPGPMIRAALSAIADALAADGAAVLDALSATPGEQAVRHQVGADAAPVLETAFGLFADAPNMTATAVTSDGHQVLVAPCHARFNTPAFLALWRARGATAWSAEERALVGSASGIIRVVLEHEAIQHELLNHARTDPLTGLFNRAAFLEELARRIDRLERENLPGTLLIVDLDDFSELNDRIGIAAGDSVLKATAALLRATFRPADLLGRIGDDEFAAWLDGADYLAAAERAEALRLRGLDPGLDPAAGAEAAGLHGVSFSIGIGTRWPGGGEEIETLMHRVDHVLFEAKRSARGQWRVSQPAPEPR